MSLSPSIAQIDESNVKIIKAQRAVGGQFYRIY